MVVSDNYPMETHYVQTEDGYILTLLRITKLETIIHKYEDGILQVNSAVENFETIKSIPKNRKPAVLMVNGLSTTGDEWFMARPENILPYNFVDGGYDCWVACNRGSRLSNSTPHISLSKNSRKYWDFCIDQMGSVDIPALIDYILDVTFHKSLYYIGCSMGAAMFFIAMSVKPEYNCKIKMMAALAPGIYIKDITNITLKLSMLGAGLLGKMKFCYQRKLFGKSATGYSKLICLGTRQTDNIAAWALIKLTKIIGMIGDTPMDKEIQIGLANTLPGITGIKIICQLAQWNKSGKFQAYDHGKSENTKKYGQETPPLYELGNVTAPVITFSAISDEMVPAKGVLQLSNELPNLIQHFEITRPEFSHGDFVVGNDTNKLVYSVVLKIFNKNECQEK